MATGTTNILLLSLAMVLLVLFVFLLLQLVLMSLLQWFPLEELLMFLLLLGSSVVIPTFGLLDWTLDEIWTIDEKTRKILTRTHNFHISTDVECLYLKRKPSDRSLTSIQNTFECRIISFRQPSNRQVCIHMADGIISLGRQLLEQHALSDNREYTPKEVALFPQMKGRAYRSRILYMDMLVANSVMIKLVYHAWVARLLPPTLRCMRLLSKNHKY